MPLVRPRPLLSELVLPVTLWSAGSDAPGGAALEAPSARDALHAMEWMRPHRLDVVGTRELRLLDPSRLGAKYFVTCRAPDEEHFRRIGAALERRRHAALGAMLLGDEAVHVVLRPAGSLFELFPVLTRPKSPRHLPLGALRVATIHITSIAAPKLEPPGDSCGDALQTETRGPLDWLWK